MTAPTLNAVVGNTHSHTISYTSSGNVNIVVLWILLQGGGTVTAVSGGTLGACTLRSRSAYVPGQTLDLTEWWVSVASGAGASVSAETFTMTVSGGENGLSQICAGVSGCDNVTPFDANTSFPATATGSSSAPSIASLNSNSSTPLVVGLVGTSQNITLGNNPGTSFTFDLNEHSYNGPPDNDLALEHYGAASALSNFTASWGTSLGGWMFLVDAFVPVDLSLTGTMTPTEATDTMSATGSPTRVGTFTTTETADTAALTGTVTIVGTFTPVEATDTWAETTILGSYGTWASTETPDVFDPADGGWSGTTGYGFGGVVGDFIVTEATDTISVDMVITISAAWVSNEATDSFNAFGYLTITGTWASTEATDYMVMSVHVSGESGPWASQEPVDKFAATGNVPVVGTFTPTEPQDVLTVVVFGAPVPPKRRIFFTC